MDLASIFILLLNWVVRILISVPLGPEIVNSRQSCSLNFLIRHVVSWHGPLRCKTAASFLKLLNIRNIFRVAFLSCSHIRLEMSALDPAGQVRISLSRGDSLLSALSCDNFDIILLFDWLVNSFFKLFWNLFDFNRFCTVFLPPFSAASIILARSQRKSKENFDFF